MTYRIARNGQIYGPYTVSEVERYLASGNIVLSDFAQAEGSAEWVPVAQLLGSPSNPTSGPAPGPIPGQTAGWTGVGGSTAAEYASTGYAPAAGAYTAAPAMAAISFNPNLYPDPPDLPWWLALILGVATGGVFFVVWDIVLAAWMRRVERSSIAVYFFAAAAVLFAFTFSTSWHSINYWIFDRPFLYHPHDSWFGGGRWLLWLVARFVLRSDLLRHFNTNEPVGLRLSGFLTFILGGLYFQYHLNQINITKRSLRMTAPAA